MTWSIVVLYVGDLKPWSNLKLDNIMKYLNLKLIDPDTIGGLKCVNRILNWDTQDPGHIDTLPSFGLLPCVADIGYCEGKEERVWCCHVHKS